MSTSRQPDDSVPKVKESRTAQATGTQANSRPQPGTVYTGRVQARQGDGTYSVALEDPKITLTGVQIALPVLGGYLGLQIRCDLPQYTKVKLTYGTPSYIFAVIPENNTDWKNARNRSLVWGPDMDGEQGVTANNFASTAEDLLEGEVEFSNLYGISIDFLTTLLRMRAGDRATVECHLINDMVRVVSGQYRHISGLGDDLSFDHGRPTRERTWASYRHEVLGALEDGKEYAPMKGDEADREAMEADRVLRIGRSRFREFMGFAGDFIHSFVSDPPETLARLAKSAGSSERPAGKSWMHRNSDGSVIIQSVADIRLERVCRIPIPVRYVSHEDPAVTKEREYTDLEEAFLRLPPMVSPTEPGDAFHMAYHIRSYARWLGRYHSFARMLQLSGEYEIPAETDSPAPDWNNHEKDREDANPGVTYYDAYACFAIHRDGSIVLHDGYGSSIVTSNGNVQISASRHLDLESAGDIRMVAGGSIHLKARRNIELSAVLGGIVIQSYAWLKMLCERGSTWLRSNARTGPNASAPTPKEDGAPTPEIAGGHTEGWAVLVEAAEGSAAYRSERGATLAVDGTPADASDESFNIHVVSKGDLDLFGQREAILHSRDDVKICAGRHASVAAPSFLSSASEFLVGTNLDVPFMAMRYGSFFCRTIEAQNLRANSIVGPDRGPQTPIPDTQPLLQLKTHFNHIDKFFPGDQVEPPEPAMQAQKDALQTAINQTSLIPPLGWVSSADGPQWSFPAKEEYVWDSREKTDSAVPETLTQQYLRLDAVTSDPDRWGGTGYKTWDLRGSIVGVRTGSLPGLGTYERQYAASDAGEDLHQPSPTVIDANTPPPEVSWKPREKFEIRALKRQGE